MQISDLSMKLMESTKNLEEQKIKFNEEHGIFERKVFVMIIQINKINSAKAKIEKKVEAQQVEIVKMEKIIETHKDHTHTHTQCSERQHNSTNKTKQKKVFLFKLLFHLLKEKCCSALSGPM